MDTGFWYASIDRSDDHYSRVAPVADEIREQVIVPIPVITETAYLILKNRGVDNLAAFAEISRPRILIFNLQRLSIT